MARLTETKKKKLNPMLLQVLLISGGIHVAALLVLGSITVYKYIIPDEAAFEEPPAVEEVEPPKDHKVEIKPQAAPQQQAMQNLRMRQVGNIAVANVDVDLPSMEQSFTVSSGLGGFGGGALLGGTRGSIGIGMSDINVFGLKARAEKVLFVIDAHRRMVYDAKGGIPSYQTIKDEIVNMVEGLSAGTLFNVVLTESGRIRPFKPQLVPAGGGIAQELREWMAPVNSSLDSLGMRGGRDPEIETKLEKYEPHYEALAKHRHGARILQYLLEANVDAIFEITGSHSGFQTFEIDESSEAQKEAAREAHEKFMADPKNIAALKAYDDEMREVRKKVSEAHKKLNKERRAKGLPDKVLEGRLEDQARFFGIEIENKRPHVPARHPPRRRLEDRDVRKYFHDLVRHLYKDKGKDAPSINVVLFLAGDEELSEKREESIEDYVRYFGGRMRVLRGLDEIRGAATASSANN